MNLPTIAIILEDHPLGKIYGASKTIHLVNSQIDDVAHHITADMTGREINAIYKALDYVLQMNLIDLDIYDEAETNIVVSQIELLNSASESEGRFSESIRELVIIFLATLLLLITVVVTVGYYENSRQHDAMISSKLYSTISALIDKFTLD